MGVGGVASKAPFYRAMHGVMSVVVFLRESGFLKVSVWRDSPIYRQPKGWGRLK